jgi:endo-1,4-beta-xylanase
MRRLSILAFAIALLAAYPAEASVVANYDFEDGTVQGWTSFAGSSTPTNTTAAAFSGTHSLLTTTGSTGSGGPGISLSSILLPGATYTITGYVMLVPGELATNANFTMFRSDPACSGGVCFDTIGSFQVSVDALHWSQIGGSYTFSSPATGALLYAQLIGPSTAESFYLDDVVINETSPPTSATPVPAALPLFATGLGALGLLGWRRKRKATSA